MIFIDGHEEVKGGKWIWEWVEFEAFIRFHENTDGKDSDSKDEKIWVFIAWMSK